MRLLGFVLLAQASALVFADGYRINFGSCNKPELPQVLWPHINKRQGNAWIWGGDNVYVSCIL